MGFGEACFRAWVRAAFDEKERERVLLFEQRRGEEGSKGRGVAAAAAAAAAGHERGARHAPT